MGYWGWKPYVPVAKRREQAARAAQKAKKAGEDFAPVMLATRTIAHTFWGKAWCENLEAYSDFENRLPRGRSYVRNGSVVDLEIEAGRVVAQVMGSSLYRIEVGIAPLPAARWKKLVGDCTGSIATLVELLQGRFSKAVMARICEPETGLFPAPAEIRLDCSCPDWATMCKHVAAVLYGVGARLDERPELLFVLRQVDASDLLAAQATGLPARAKKPAKGKVLDDAALADVFGIEMAAADGAEAEAPKTRRAAATAKTAKAGNAARTADAVKMAPTATAGKAAKSVEKRKVAKTTKSATTAKTVKAARVPAAKTAGKAPARPAGKVAAAPAGKPAAPSARRAAMPPGAAAAGKNKATPAQATTAKAGKATKPVGKENAAKTAAQLEIVKTAGFPAAKSAGKAPARSARKAALPPAAAIAGKKEATPAKASATPARARKRTES